MTNDKDSNRSVEYTYDALNRIASAATPNTDCSLVPGTTIPKNWGETMTIDAWGNLTARTVTKCSADGLSVTALSNNQLNGFGYDAAGDMTSNGSASYTYNAEAQLKTAGGVTYTYDGDGHRVKKSNGTEYWGSLLESDGSGTLQREFIFAGGKRLARRDISGGAVHYYFTDRLGSSSVVTSSAGAVENESDFLPYGTERIYTQTLTNQNYKFTGKERDSESGLDDFGARFDASTLGRFMTPDWASRPMAIPYGRLINPQSLDLYAYALNSPVTTSDLDGHQDVDIAFGWLSRLFDDRGGHVGPPTCTSGRNGKVDPQPPPTRPDTNKPLLPPRVKLALKGVGNIVVGVGKTVAAAGAAAAAPETGGLSVPLAIYAGIGAAGNYTAGGAQLVAAVTGNEEMNKAADVAAAVTTVSGFVTLAKTGDLDKAADNAAIEGLFTAGLTGGATGNLLGESTIEKAATVIDLTQNVQQLATPPDNH